MYFVEKLRFPCNMASQKGASVDLQMKQIREKLGLSQNRAAELLEMNPRTYGGWERQENQINVVDAVRVAELFSCTLDELAGRETLAIDYADARQAKLNTRYIQLTEEYKDAALASIEGMAMATSVAALKNEMQDNPLSSTV
jgi:transcriptional regulator with XRE-family HTH domain